MIDWIVKSIVVYLLMYAAINGLLYVIAFGVNASSGCYPWAPKTVLYHEGITLCPGQTVLMSAGSTTGNSDTQVHRVP